MSQDFTPLVVEKIRTFVKTFPKVLDDMERLLNRNRIFIAEHGSWNRSQKTGYRVSMVTLEGNRALAYEPFASGWLQGESAWGRPADVLVLPNSSAEKISGFYTSPMKLFEYFASGKSLVVSFLPSIHDR